MAGQIQQRFVKRPRGGRLRHPPAHLQRIPLRRQVERRIERMETLVTGARVAQALDPHRAEGRLQAAFVHAPLRTLDTVGPLDRTGRLPRTALVEMPLQELAYQLLTTPLQLPFEVALTHLQGLARREVGFGLREGGLRLRIRRRGGWNGAVGNRSHGSMLPQPPLRIPDQRIDQNRLGRLAGTAAVPVHAPSTARDPQRDPVGGAIRTPVVAAEVHQRLHQPRLEVVAARPVRRQPPRPRASTALARFRTPTHGSSRKRLLLTTCWRFRARVASSHPTQPSRAAMRHAGLENCKQPTTVRAGLDANTR